MVKCPKCFTEVEDGAKFCDECGAPIPQEKKCPKCGVILKPNAKFCSECGYSFKANGATSSGIAMGDKNVVAGDVIGQKDDYHVSGNATFIKNDDETKKVVQCHCCGKNLTIVEVFTCPECGKETCADCYDKSSGACRQCVSKKDNDKEAEYLKLLEKVLEDGKIELSERKELKALQKVLKISDSRAQELESKCRKQTAAGSIGEYEIMYCQQAAEELWGKGDPKAAMKIMEPVYKNYPHDQDVLSVYYPALAFLDEDKAIKAMDAVGVDSAIIARTRVDIDIRHESFVSAEAKLKTALELWPEDVPLKCRRALCLYSAYVKFGKKDVLNAALDIVATLPSPETKCERTWAYYLRSLLAPETKNGFSKKERKDLQSKGIYSALAGGELLGIKPILVDELVKTAMKALRKDDANISFTDDELRALESSAGNGDADAACVFGWYSVFKGQEVEKGIRFVKEAALADVADAQYLLATYIDSGLINGEDPIAWYKKASSSGHQKAKAAVSACEKKQKEMAKAAAVKQAEEEKQAKKKKEAKAFEDSKPLRDFLENGLVEIPDTELFIGKTQVTQALWKYVMGENPSKFKGDDRPVESVSIPDCEVFLNALNEIDLVKKKRLKFRLPSEDEWKFVQGGRVKDYNDSCWIWETSNRETHGVARKKPNEYGLYDVFGNVAEWCSEGSRDSRLCLGGSYLVGGYDVCKDDYYSCETRSSTIGLRLVAFRI